LADQGCHRPTVLLHQEPRENLEVALRLEAGRERQDKASATKHCIRRWAVEDVSGALPAACRKSACITLEHGLLKTVFRSTGALPIGITCVSCMTGDYRVWTREHFLDLM
jgi:hypothetical protein